MLRRCPPDVEPEAAAALGIAAVRGGRTVEPGRVRRPGPSVPSVMVCL
jgi:hypothetical protein